MCRTRERNSGEEREGSGNPKMAGTGRNRKTFRNIVSYFAIEKAQKGGNHNGRCGTSDPPVPSKTETGEIL